MDKEVHPKEIEFVNQEIVRLEKTMKEGFQANLLVTRSIEEKLDALNRSYVSRQELDYKCKEIYQYVNKAVARKSDIWVQKVVAGLLVIILAGFMGAVVTSVWGV